MPISSNAVFHFTKTKEALKGILEGNFKIKHCKETIRIGKEVAVVRVPMVSFCDIPLSQVKEHVGRYGGYGLGLKREWAVSRKLNPVLYVEPDSNLSASYRAAVGDLFKAQGVDGRTETASAYSRLLDILRYMKPFEDVLQRAGAEASRYRFADEREWRYVPSLEELKRAYVLEKDWPSLGDEASAEIVDFRLSFEPNDIRYVIIRDDFEIDEFVDHLRKVKGKKYTHDDVQRLTTRLVTIEQVKADF
jgi:hypothetical protein